MHRINPTIARFIVDRRGFSLLECSLATVLVGVLLVASIRCVSAAARQRAALLTQHQGMGLAQMLAGEIQQACYLEPTEMPMFGREASETSTNRSMFDDVDDYHSWSESPPKTKNGDSLTEYVGWIRSVAVAYVDPANPLNTSTDKGLKRFTITVTSPTGKTTVLVGLRAEGGIGEPLPSEQTSYVTWAGVQLRPTTGSTTIRSGATFLNQTPAN